MLGIFLDLETSGLDYSKHRILEIAFKVVDLHTGEPITSYEEVICQSQEVWELRDPVSCRVNGFTLERMQEGKPESEVSQAVIEHFKRAGVRRGQAIFICQNPSFDRAFFAQLVPPYQQEDLQWPYHWLDFASMFWVLRIHEAREKGEVFPERLHLGKDSIAQHYNLPREEHPHRARNGVDHLMQCYFKVVGRLPVQSPAEQN